MVKSVQEVLEMKQIRETRGEIIERLVAIPENKRQELIERYKSDKLMDPITISRHRIFVGTWLNITVKMIRRGLTEAELDRMIEHLFVVASMYKHNLDLEKSDEDHKIKELCDKYILTKESEKRIYADRQKQLEHAAKKRGALMLKKQGKSNQEIAEELGIPESTVRFFLKNVTEE